MLMATTCRDQASDLDLESFTELLLMMVVQDGGYVVFLNFKVQVPSL